MEFRREYMWQLNIRGELGVRNKQKKEEYCRDKREAPSVTQNR